MASKPIPDPYEDAYWVTNASTGHLEKVAAEVLEDHGVKLGRPSVRPALMIRLTSAESCTLDRAAAQECYMEFHSRLPNSLPESGSKQDLPLNPIRAHHIPDKDGQSLGEPDSTGLVDRRSLLSIPRVVWIPLGLYSLHHYGDTQWLLACLSAESPVPVRYHYPMLRWAAGSSRHQHQSVPEDSLEKSLHHVEPSEYRLAVATFLDSLWSSTVPKELVTLSGTGGYSLLEGFQPADDGYNPELVGLLAWLLKVPCHHRR